MAITYSGRILWANGAPVPNVQVRLFRPLKDQSLGAELTLAPGLSNADGTFTIQSRDSRFLDSSLLSSFDLLSSQFDEINSHGFDLGDDPRPIFQFTFSINGRSVQTQAPLRRLHRGYYLPYNCPVDFLPSRDGFDFVNSFKPFDPLISLPAWLDVSRIPGSYGLCGGMSSAAYDFCLAHTVNTNSPDIRQFHDVPKTGTSLHRYLIRRSLDTFGVAGRLIGRVGDWTLLPDQGSGGVQNLSLVEFSNIFHNLQNGQCGVLTLIYERAANFSEMMQKIWLNHQVLAYGYTATGPDSFKIHIYDSNFKNRDDASLQIHQVQVGSSNGQPIYGLVSREVIPGQLDKEVRGFFSMNYQPSAPPG
jgi:hypothetical protein